MQNAKLWSSYAKEPTRLQHNQYTKINSRADDCLLGCLCVKQRFKESGDRLKYIASVSFGKDSLCMLLKLIEEEWPLDCVIFYDTGMEFEAIYKNVDRAKTMLAERGIEFIILQNDMGFEFNMFSKRVQSTDGTVKYGQGWCGRPCRWGTSLKTDEINRFYKRLGKEMSVEYIGIAFDERERISRKKTNNRIKIYPLIEWGMTEPEALQYCYDHGWNWEECGRDLYDLLDRVSCYCCKNKNKKELRNMWKYLPSYWEDLKYLQSKIAEPMKEYGSVFDLEKEFEAEENEK